MKFINPDGSYFISIATTPMNEHIYNTYMNIYNLQDRVIKDNKIKCNENYISISVDELWYNLIANKKKTIEGRLNKNGIEKIKKGDIICIKNKKYSDKSLLVIVKDRKHYDTVYLYLKECLHKALPIKNIKIKNGIDIYKQYISDKTDKQMGIEALTIELLDI
jgi:ASC-1-like (ASCH) protein